VSDNAHPTLVLTPSAIVVQFEYQRCRHGGISSGTDLNGLQILDTVKIVLGLCASVVWHPFRFILLRDQPEARTCP
jgi:hypothetical protein